MYHLWCVHGFKSPCFELLLEYNVIVLLNTAKPICNRAGSSKFYLPLKNFSLIWIRHHCRWSRPMLGAQGLWAGRDLYRATPAVTWGLGFSGLIPRRIQSDREKSLLCHSVSPISWRGAGLIKPMLGSQGLWIERDLYCATWFFLSHPEERPIPSPLTTHIVMSVRMRPRSCVKAGVAW